MEGRLSDTDNVRRVDVQQGKRRSAWWLLRKLDRGFGLILYVSAIVLIAMAAVATYYSVSRSGWGSDAAAWVQAAGSIAAIVGAAWLAQDEARRARLMRREQKEEAAWYIRFMIVQAQCEAQIIAAELVNRTALVTKYDAREWRQRAATCRLGLGALIGGADHVHPAVTHVTSNAKVLIDDLFEELIGLGKLVDEGGQPDEELVGRIVAPHRALTEVVELYDARMRGVRVALDDGNHGLPIRSFAAWNS